MAYENLRLQNALKIIVQAINYGKQSVSTTSIITYLFWSCLPTNIPETWFSPGKVRPLFPSCDQFKQSTDIRLFIRYSL